MNNIKYILLLFILFPVLAWGQSDLLVITGKVTSELDGELIGVQVTEVDKNKRVISATVTDYSGNFSLQIKNPANMLNFSYVGYKALALQIGDRRKFNVNMEDNTQLQEVVIKARAMHSDGTLSIPQREISGAVQRISTKEFEGLSVSSIDDALQGRIAGLDIVSNSGNLGSGSSLRIRGVTSINSSSEPLIVVDDIPFENNVDPSFDYANSNQEQFANLLSLNPDDIDEIVVLKDGSAAAIWGSKGANGVISIRTKRGVTGPTRVNYSYRFSASRQPKGLKLLNGDDYTMLMKQAYFNPGQDETRINSIKEFNYDPTFSEYHNFNNNTDWVKALTQYGMTHDHNLSISGGGERARFRASVSYYDETGIVIEQNLQRFSSRINMDYSVSERLKFTSELAFTHTVNHKNNNGDNGEDLLGMAYKKMPNVSIYQKDAYGNDTDVFYNILRSSELHESQRDLMNPVGLAHLATNDNKNIRILPSFRLSYDFLDPMEAVLRYSGHIAFDFENNKDNKFIPREVSSKNWSDDVINRTFGRESEALAVQSDQNITWIPDWGEDHSFSFYASWQFRTTDSQFEEYEKYGVASTSITNPNANGAQRNLSSGSSQGREMAMLGRVHYTYLSRYVLDLSLRRDGSSRFGTNNRWGNFPAASLKWIISDELFMAPTQAWLSELGIRAGVGVTGNRPDSEYLHFSRYNGSWADGGNNYINISTLKPSSVKLADLRWEKSTSYNLGVDIHLFDFKYSMDANLYHRRTEDLLFKDQGLPSTSGFSSIPYINAGTMDNDGWEFNFSTNRMFHTKDWTVDVNLNLSNYTNKIISLKPSILSGYNSDFDYKNGTYLTRIQEGNSFGSIYGFRYKGVYQYDKYEEGREGTSPFAIDADGNVIKDSFGNPVPMYFAYGNVNYVFRGGDAIYEDVNNDGTIDELDIVYLGNCNPKINGGFGTTVRYKRLSVNAFFNFRAGNKIINFARMDAENMYTNDNQSVAVNWRWRKDGDITNIPRALYEYGYNHLGSDRFVEDGSFLRFKYLTFNYSVNPVWVKRYGLEQLNMYLTLNNVATFTKYKGVDPEVSQNGVGISEDRGRTPRSQSFTLGITVGF